MADAPVRALVAEEELPTPDRAVRSKPDAVEGNAKDGAAQTVLGKDARDVRVVMLHAHFAGARVPPFLGEARRRVVRVQVGGNSRRARAEEPQIGAQCLVVMGERGRTVEVADMRSRKGVAARGARRTCS